MVLNANTTNPKMALYEVPCQSEEKVLLCPGMEIQGLKHPSWKGERDPTHVYLKVQGSS